MSVSVNMWSTTCGEIKRFLEAFYEQEMHMDENTGQWFCEFGDPLESADIISAVIDNSHNFNIALYIQVDKGDLYRITEDNFNDVIKGLFILYYRDK